MLLRVRLGFGQTSVSSGKGLPEEEHENEESEPAAEVGSDSDESEETEPLLDPTIYSSEAIKNLLAQCYVNMARRAFGIFFDWCKY